MSQLHVSCFSLSLDGYAAGPEQSLENPTGIGGLEIHDWQFATATFRRSVLGEGGGETGIDDDFVARGFENIGAWVMGRNMFGPVRGPWRDERACHFVSEGPSTSPINSLYPSVCPE